MSEIYQPKKDSYLMSLVLEKEIPLLLKDNNNLKFLEIGCGSGINLKKGESLGIKNKNILTVDINLEAVKHCKALGFNSMKSNLFEKINKKFDLIIFNPPYLPKDSKGIEPEASKISTTGGKKGNEIILKFLKQAKEHLEQNGKLFLLTSSLTPKINFKKLGYGAKILEKEKLFYEQLFVWELVV